MLSRTVENAQKKVEQQNFLIRKRVLEYDDVMNEQRRVIYKYRREILEGRDMSEVAREEIGEVVERLVEEYTAGEVFEDWDLGGPRDPGRPALAADRGPRLRVEAQTSDRERDRAATSPRTR